MTRSRRRLLEVGLLLVVGATAVQPSGAQPLPAPSGPVILEIRGELGQRNGADAARFDAAMLRSLPQASIATRTPWYDQRKTFSGPLLQSVLQRVQAKGRLLRMEALNDYAVDIPWSDLVEYQPVLAWKIDGKLLTVRDKGPLFLIYPFDQQPELRNDVFYGRSIWQLLRITVL